MNSLEVLKLLNKTNPDIEKKMLNYANTIKGLDLSNNEAHAAKLFFKEIFGNSFVRTDENNHINKYLNYGYSVLLSFIVRNLSAKGYDPRLGIFHKSYNNNFALGTDFMEPFRCLIDKLVFEFRDKNEFIDFNEYKRSLFKLFYENVKINNKVLSIDEYIKKTIEELILIKKAEGLIIDWGSK